MFDIEYKGGNTITLATKKTTVVVDPKRSVVGLKDESVKGAVELATEARLAVSGQDAKLVIDGPGEYEIGDVSIQGIPAFRHIDGQTGERLSTVYRLEVGGVRLAVIGNVDPKLSESQLESIGVVDIVVLPVGGGGYTLDATSAATIVRQIEPKVVIPTHYADSGVSYEVTQDTLDTFVKEIGGTVETVSKYKVKSLPDVLTVVELTRS